MTPFTSKKSTRDHLTELTKQLIQVPSNVNEPLKIFELIEFIKRYFEGEQVVIKSHVISGVPSLFITTQETKHPHILLSGHIDVVPSSNMYVPREENGWLFGSGAMDMKSGVAVMMAIMKYWSRQKSPLSLGIMITADEETGSKYGVASLLRDEGYGADFGIINEGRHAYEIVTREKGILTIKLAAHGRYLHSAYPWKATHPIEELIEVARAIGKLFPTPREGWLPTCSITVFKAGEEPNTIPGYAEVTLNIRLTGGARWSKEATMQRIEKVIQKMNKNVSIIETHYGDIFMIDEKNPYITLLKKTARRVTKKSVPFGENHGASEATIFMQHGIPVAVLGPVGRNHHTPDEAVLIESIGTHYEVLKEFIEAQEKQQKENLTKVLEG